MRVSSRKLLYTPRKLLRKHPLMIIQLPATSIHAANTHIQAKIWFGVSFFIFSVFGELSLNGECFFGPPITL